MHAILYYRRQIWVQARRSLSEQPDIHARLMSRYPQVPQLWYGIVFCEFIVRSHLLLTVYSGDVCHCASIVEREPVLSKYRASSPSSFGQVTSPFGHSSLPSLSVCSLVSPPSCAHAYQAYFYVIPVGMIQAITNQVRPYLRIRGIAC